MALLLLRSTPLDCNLQSPAKLLFNRDIRTTIPKLTDLRLTDLTPSPLTPTSVAPRSSRPPTSHRKPHRTLRPLDPGEPVYLRNPLTSHWVPGTVRSHRSEPRSYDVTNVMDPERVLRRNRLDIRPRAMTSPPPTNSSDPYLGHTPVAPPTVEPSSKFAPP